MTTILVRPARPENVGSACRALKNMGLSSLAIVAPGFDRSAANLRNPAYGAWDVLDGAVRFESLQDAIEEAHLVVGLSGRLLPGRSVDVRALGSMVLERSWRGERTALVFGPEASGLPRTELDLCHVVARIPAHEDHPSLNLAQAVLLAGWEIRRAASASRTGETAVDPELSAPAGELESCLADLEEALLVVGYLNPQNPNLVLAEIRRLLARARPTRRELSILRGLARQVRWAGTVAREGRPRIP